MSDPKGIAKGIANFQLDELLEKAKGKGTASTEEKTNQGRLTEGALKALEIESLGSFVDSGVLNSQARSILETRVIPTIRSGALSFGYFLYQKDFGDFKLGTAEAESIMQNLCGFLGNRGFQITSDVSLRSFDDNALFYMLAISVPGHNPFEFLLR